MNVTKIRPRSVFCFLVPPDNLIESFFVAITSCFPLNGVSSQFLKLRLNSNWLSKSTLVDCVYFQPFLYQAYRKTVC